jgi:hypothetical protein
MPLLVGLGGGWGVMGSDGWKESRDASRGKGEVREMMDR